MSGALPLWEIPVQPAARVQGNVECLDGATRSARAGWPVALVAMPFASIRRPSIQLGLLKAIAASHGFPVSTFHLNLDFAQQIGPSLYEGLCQHRGRLFGEWLFSLAAFGDAAPDPEDRLFDAVSPQIDVLLEDLDETREWLRALRHEEVPRFLDRLMEMTWERFRVVGFTSTFQQNAAAFALAARIKQRCPEVILLFGGANFEGEMGLEWVRSIPCIDYAVIGEGDLAFPEFLIALQEGRDPASVPGIVCRRDGALTELRARPPFHEMDALPTPDYEEYFERAEALGLLPAAARREVGLSFESARGCWWGEKQHCTFCGLNTLGMAFRAKSPGRVLEELTELARRYRSFRFTAVDNIADLSYLRTLFPCLIEAGFDADLFYEVKANLTREQIQLLAEAGVRRIQPGIESLSTRVLRLMRKGITAIQNVNLLRWTLYYDVGVGWNLIWGFPGETEEDYRAQAALLPHLIHLPPPHGAGRIWMERYSPIFFDREAFPARSLRPEASHGYIYPQNVDLERAAYFFDFELGDTLPDAAYEETSRLILAWRNAWDGRRRPALTFWSAPGFLQIEDQRDPAAPGTYSFEGPLALLYTACSNRPHSAPSLRNLHGLEWPAEEIEEALDAFCARGLMMRDGNAFLSLALPAMRGR